MLTCRPMKFQNFSDKENLKASREPSLSTEEN